MKKNKNLSNFKIIFALMTFAIFSNLFFSCMSDGYLYDWYNYSTTAYNYVKKADEKSLKELIKTYEKIMSQQTGVRETIPPGMCADYGYILLRQGETAKGMALLEKEIELYPESAKIVQRILKAVKE